MARPQGANGAATRVHLEAAAARGDARARAALEGPPLPEACAHVWTWFLELNAARTISAPPTPLGYGDIAVWAGLTGRRPRRLELEWLKALDRFWLAPPEKPDGGRDVSH